jgi:hypothetical protein
MKKLLGYVLTICTVMIVLQNGAKASYTIAETWNADLRSQITVECSPLTSVCQQLCNNAKTCVLKNSTCKDCISTGIKMTYFYAAFGKDINSDDNSEVTIYEFVDFLLGGNFIAFSANNIYNQFDSAQSDALAQRFKSMCPNGYETPIAFFKIEKRELDIQNAKYVTCGEHIYKLEINSSLLE